MVDINQLKPMNMKQRELTLFKRDVYREEDYKEWCYDNDKEYDENDTYAFFEWESQMEEWDFEDMLDGCKYSKLKNNAVVVVGSLGLWYGRRDIEPTKCDNFVDAIYKCMGGCAMIQEVVKKGNRIDVTTVHHDGRNYFSIFFLTEIGADRYDRNGTISVRNRENIMKLPEYLWY